MKKTIFALAVVSFLGSVTAANAYTVKWFDGSLQNTDGLTTFGTTGADMSNMAVNFTYGDGTIGTYTWNSSGSDKGGLTSWSDGTFELSGDSYNKEWTLDISTDSVQIASIFIDAGAGSTVFDIWSGDHGSSGSADGDPFDPWLNGGDDPNNIITATYSGAVGIGGAPPVGDLYRYLQIDFAPGSFFSSTDTLTFFADTDNATNGVNPVPEASTILLFGLGIAGFAGYTRKRKQ